MGRHGFDSLYVDTTLGREGVPGGRFGKWALNSLGYRGAEPVEGRQKILVFGASESFGMYESPGMEYPAQLQRLLDQVAPGVYSVVNAAAPGMRIGNLDLLQLALQRARPSHVVLYPSPVGYTGVGEPYCSRPPRGPSVRTGEPGGDLLRLPGRLWVLARGHLPEALQDALRVWSIERQLAGRAPRDEAAPESVRAFAADVECARDAVLRAGAVPILMSHATYFGGEFKYEARAEMNAWRRFYPDLSGKGLLDLEAKGNIEVARVGGLPETRYVDLASVMDPGPRNFADFVHFNDEGASVVAGLLAQTILGR